MGQVLITITNVVAHGNFLLLMYRRHLECNKMCLKNLANSPQNDLNFFEKKLGAITGNNDFWEPLLGK